MNIDWNLLSAWAALITAVAAIVALWLQGRWTRFSVSLDLLLRSEDQFRNNEKMLEKRRKAAQALLKGEIVTELDDVLDFFELVGLLMRRGALDEEMVWYSFYTRAIGYWTSAQKYISDVRSKDKTIWMDFEYLIMGLIAIEKRKTRRSHIEILPSEESLKKFLTDESTIS